MRIYATSDIHIDSNELNWMVWKNLAELCKKDPPDLLLICGDLAESLVDWQKALELFHEIRAEKLIVPGNHDLWSRSEKEPHSLAKYNHYLGEICHNSGWHYLPKNPWIRGKIGIAGSCCWYDYSLLPEDHPFSMEELQKKARGGLRWMDATACRWMGVDHEQLDYVITDLFFQDLKKDLEIIAHHCEYKILATHFPFYSEFLDYEGLSWDRAYFGAFMGSDRYRELLGDYQIDVHICGHLHSKKVLNLNGTQVVLSPVGSVKEWHTKDPLARLDEVLLRLEVGDQ